MKVKDLIAELQKLNQDWPIEFSITSPASGSEISIEPSFEHFDSENGNYFIPLR